MKSPAYLLLIITLIIHSLPLYSQSYGQIFTKQEADQQFGEVITSIEISTAVIEDLMARTGNHLMFKISNNTLIILDESRMLLYPTVGVAFTDQDVFTMFSNSIINKLISLGNSAAVYVEERREVLSISIGNYTMEVGALCPPICVE